MWEPHIWSPEEVRAFWDYESQFPENYWSRINGKSLLKRYSKFVSSAAKICDLGCGEGGLLESLVPALDGKAVIVYGFDTSRESVQKVNNKFSQYSCFGGCFSELDELLEHSGGDIDLIFCCEVVEHVYDDDLRKIMRSARSLINPKSGKLVITTPNNEDLAASYVLNPVTRTVFHRWQHVRSWSEASIVSMLDEEGFGAVLVEQLNIAYFSGNPMKNIYCRLRSRHKPNLFVVAELRGSGQG
jgi:2-polyprenyl-3-methyl-5-hydroxy-6-metoxy-1,4-benzoquinol methylase